jgi:PAS domain-containing protein
MIASNDATQMMPAGSWTDPRIHLLDDAWLLTIFAILLATVVPWLVSGLDINFVAVSLGILVLGAIHVSFSMLRRPTSARQPVLTALHVLGVLAIGVIWRYAGGLQNPAFLIVFALPVIGSIFLSRWQPYLMALVAIVATVAVAITQAPEMRWYVPGLTAIGAWLAAVSGQEVVPFPGFYAPSGYYIVLFEVFAILLVACALAAEYLGTVFERLLAHVDVARVEAEHGQKFWSSLIEDLPLPALLVDTDSLRVLSASKRVADLVGIETEGESLFEAIQFSYPDLVQELINERGGVVPVCLIRVGGEWRVTAVHVQHVVQKGGELALVSIHDKTEEFMAKTALDVTGLAVLVIDARDRILAFNKPARALFAGIHKDAAAGELLSLPEIPARWWETGSSGRRKALVNIAPRVYEVTTSAAPLPGEEERIYIVTFQPVARAAGNQTQTTLQLAPDLNATTVNRTLVAPQ